MIIPNIWENKKCSKPPTSIQCLAEGLPKGPTSKVWQFHTKGLKPLMPRRRWRLFSKTSRKTACAFLACIKGQVLKTVWQRHRPWGFGRSCHRTSNLEESLATWHMWGSGRKHRRISGFVDWVAKCFPHSGWTAHQKSSFEDPLARTHPPLPSMLWSKL